MRFNIDWWTLAIVLLNAGIGYAFNNLISAAIAFVLLMFYLEVPKEGSHGQD